MKDRARIYFALLKKSRGVLDKLKDRDFNETSLSTYECSTLYTTLPQNLKKINLLILFKEPTIEKAILILHLTTGTRCLIRKKN